MLKPLGGRLASGQLSGTAGRDLAKNTLFWRPAPCPWPRGLPLLPLLFCLPCLLGVGIEGVSPALNLNRTCGIITHHSGRV